MEKTRSNPFATLAALMLGTLFIAGIAFGVYVAVQRGLVTLPPAQLMVDGQAPAARPVIPAAGTRPAFAPPAPQSQPAAPVDPAPQVAPQDIYQPVGHEAPAPAEAVPAGAPLSDQYRETIQSQQRMNDKGEFCAPRSGCTKPGSGGPQPGPVGAP